MWSVRYQAGHAENGNFPDNIILKKTDFVNNASVKTDAKIVKTFIAPSRNLYRTHKNQVCRVYFPLKMNFLSFHLSSPAIFQRLPPFHNPSG